MKIITYINSKGGVAKTTSINGMASILALADYKVLLIDLDPQENLTSTFTNNTEYEEREDMEYVYSNLFCQKMMLKKSVTAYIVNTNTKNIDILPASDELADVIYKIYDVEKNEKNAVNYFRHNINLLKNEYDYIMIDTSPFTSYLSKCAIAASDEILTPINTDNYSYNGLVKLIDMVEKTNQKYGSSAMFAGVFFSRAKKNTVVYNELERQYKELLGDKFIPTAVSDCIAVAEANTQFTPLHEYAPKCKAMEDYEDIVNYLGWIDNKHIRILHNAKGEIK